MGRIRILSDTVANKIAAGEVVERPSSVVKELLENSIDAGADDIRVDVESGGRRLIRITDNGCGMLRDDALLAFERHATSKLRDVQDLLAIATLGFRGEALPSIASVSRLLLETRSPDESTGTTVEITGGKILRCDESALASGTVVTVRDLFFNIPARRKFLRTEQTELAHIASLATHYSLAHPAKAFSLRNGANELLSVTPVSSLRDRVYQVFGSQTLEELIDLGYQEREMEALPGQDEEGPQRRVFALRGFVSKPHIHKTNRNSIYLFVNGRLIRDRLLLHAISASFQNLMPSSCFPFALLFLDCDCEEVDVNVHPSKTEVRFRHGSFVHDFVRDKIREVLLESRPVSRGAMPTAAQTAAVLPYSEFSQRIEDHESQPFNGPPDTAAESSPILTLKTSAAPPQRFDFGPSSGLAVQENTTGARSRVPDTHGEFPADFLGEPTSTMAELRELRALGQIHNSFIVAAGRDGLWIIDQHVAHERILFEQVLRERTRGRVQAQQLLMPMVIELTHDQHIQYGRIADELNATGFETEPFGKRTVAVKAAPAFMGSSQIEPLVLEILEEAEGELRSLSVEDLRRNVAASIACRAAIKINTPLDQRKIDWLLSALAETDYPMSCPHGRPIALRYATRDILRGFHRI